MKKIITAIDNPKLNEEIKKEKNMEVIGKDIQYKEGILEILEKNQEIEIIIIKEDLPGKIDNINLINKIKQINKKIKIIFLLEKQNKEKEEELKKQDIEDIYYNNIKISKFIKIIKEKEINQEEELKKEIEKLKQIIIEKNKKEIKKLKSKKIKISHSYQKNHNAKIIYISGENKTGKTTFAFNLSYLLKEKNKKVLMINFNLEKEDKLYLFYINKYNKIKNRTEKEISLNLNSEKNSKNFKSQQKEFLIHLHKNIDILSKQNFLSHHFQQDSPKGFFKLIEKLKPKYDYIILDIDKKMIQKEKIIYRKEFCNMIIIEGNCLGILEAKEVINKWKKTVEKQEIKFNIIMNKKNKNTINKEILKNIFKENKEIGELNYHIFYNKQINFLLQKSIWIQNKTIKKEYEKIIKQIGK